MYGLSKNYYNLIIITILIDNFYLVLDHLLRLRGLYILRLEPLPSIIDCNLIKYLNAYRITMLFNEFVALVNEPSYPRQMLVLGFALYQRVLASGEFEANQHSEQFIFEVVSKVLYKGR